MKHLAAFAGLFLLLLSPAAEAAPGGIYLGAHGAVTAIDEAMNESGAGSFTFDFDPGYGAGVTLGYDLRERFPAIGFGRVELEAAFRKNQVKEAAYGDGGLTTEGDVTVSSLMFNTFGESRSVLPWIPYAGAGIGVARVELDQIRFGEVLLVDGDDLVFAWQAGAGLGLVLSRHITLDLGYRFFSAVNPKFQDAQGVRFESRYDSHQVLLGARIDF